MQDASPQLQSTDEQTRLIPRSVFSVDVVKPRDKYPLWKESISIIFDVEAERDVRDSSFKASVDAHMFGQLVLARTTTLRQIWSRDEKVIARDGMNHFMIQVFESGSMWLNRNGERIAINRSGIIVYDMSRTCLTGTNDFTNLSLIMPRHLIEPSLRQPDRLHLCFLPATMPLVGLLIDHMKGLKLQADTISFQQAMEINPATISLAAACLNNAFDGQTQSTSHDGALGMLARKLIEDHLHEFDLSVDKLARMMTISRSRLYEFFKAHGGVRAYIQQRRLKEAFRRLSDPALAHRSIADIAYSTGFRNDSAFSQAFKKAFGMSPKEARVLNSRFYGTVPHTDLTDRRYETWIKDL